MCYERCLFLYAKLIDCFLGVCLTWIQSATWEVRMIRCIWELLCLEAYCAAAWEGCTMLTLDACQEVTCVHLQTWFCGVNLHGTTTNWIFDASSKAHLAFFLLIQYIVVVVTRTILNLLVVRVDVLADWLWSAEIEWCTLYLQDFTCWDRLLIYRQIVVCVNLTDDVVDGWCWVSDSLD